MRKLFITCLIGMSLCLQAQVKKSGGYPITPVPFTAVKVTDAFWGQRLKASREKTIPLAFSKCEETGRYKNFVMAATPSEKNKVEGFTFDDTDVYKTIEGASYSMQTFPNKKLDKYIDSVLNIVAKAQEPDGYLYTFRTMNPKHTHEWAGTKRWEKEEDLSHELYNLGHMIEGAIAHYQSTGKRSFLDIAIKYAEATKVSVIIALNPILTFVGMAVLGAYEVSWIEAEHFTFLSLVGAVIVLAGAIITILSRRKKEIFSEDKITA